MRATTAGALLGVMADARLTTGEVAQTSVVMTERHEAAPAVGVIVLSVMTAVLGVVTAASETTAERAVTTEMDPAVHGAMTAGAVRATAVASGVMTEAALTTAGSDATTEFDGRTHRGVIARQAVTRAAVRSVTIVTVVPDLAGHGVMTAGVVRVTAVAMTATGGMISVTGRATASVAEGADSAMVTDRAEMIRAADSAGRAMDRAETTAGVASVVTTLAATAGVASVGTIEAPDAMIVAASAAMTGVAVGTTVVRSATPIVAASVATTVIEETIVAASAAMIVLVATTVTASAAIVGMIVVGGTIVAPSVGMSRNTTRGVHETKTVRATRSCQTRSSRATLRQRLAMS